jgi:hypothetical protein
MFEGEQPLLWQRWEIGGLFHTWEASLMISVQRELSRPYVALETLLVLSPSLALFCT